jgi:hypothetical protein
MKYGIKLYPLRPLKSATGVLTRALERETGETGKRELSELITDV